MENPAPVISAAPVYNPYEAAAHDEITTSWIAQVRTQSEADALQIQALNLYFGLFVFGALLLLIYPFWPRRRVFTGKRFIEDSEAGSSYIRIDRAHFGFFGAMLLMILCAISHQTVIDQHRGFISDQARKLEKELREAAKKGPQARDELIQSHYLYLPQENSLRYLSLGNMGLAADYLWLTSLQYVSSPFRQGQKFDLLYRFYEGIQESDAEWVEAQVSAGRLLSALDPDRTKAEKFFMRSLALNPQDWTIPYEGGRHYVVPPSDARRLAEFSFKSSLFFHIALERKALPENARAEISHLIGLLESESGQNSAAAETLFKNANDPNVPKSLRDISSRQFLGPESKRRAEEVQKLVSDVKKRYGNYPASLDILFAGKMPADAYGYPLDYNPATGVVSSRGAKLLKMIQDHAILNQMILMFNGEVGRFPRDLTELSRFILAHYYGIENVPFTVQDAFGHDLDCVHTALGNPWPYDPATGTATLPPEASARLLYRNMEYVQRGQKPPQFTAAAIFPAP